MTLCKHRVLWTTNILMDSTRRMNPSKWQWSQEMIKTMLRVKTKKKMIAGGVKGMRQVVPGEIG